MKRLLEFPLGYLAFQWLIGAKKARRRLLNEFAFPRAGERVLDVGCGPGYVIDYLPAVRYVGIDIDQRYIRYAMRRYGDQGEFHCTELTPSNATEFGHFDLVLLNGVLHHLSDQQAAQLLMTIRGMLSSSGRLLTLDGCFREHMSFMSRVAIENDRGQFVRDESGYLALVSPIFSKVEPVHRNDLFSIPYDALIMKCCVDRVEQTTGLIQ